MNKLTVAVVPRDRFSKTAKTVRSIIKNTPQPYRLVIVDPGMPKRYKVEVDRAAAGHPNPEFLRSDEQLDSNTCKNWVIREEQEAEWIAFVENDNEVEPGWIEYMMQACDETGADVARPMIFERKLFRKHAHFDLRFGSIETEEGPEGKVYRIHPRKTPVSEDTKAERQLTTVLEVHCVLFRRSVFDRIGFFDERVTTRQEVDVALQLYDAGIPVVFEPKAVITYHRPPPVYRDEREYFLTRWDFNSGKQSHEVIQEKWPLRGLPASMEFVRDRSNFVSYSRYITYFMLHQFGPYLKYEFWPNLKYLIYRATSVLPKRLAEPAQRALYR